MEKEPLNFVNIDDPGLDNPDTFARINLGVVNVAKTPPISPRVTFNRSLALTGEVTKATMDALTSAAQLVVKEAFDRCGVLGRYRSPAYYRLENSTIEGDDRLYPIPRTIFAACNEVSYAHLDESERSNPHRVGRLKKEVPFRLLSNGSIVAKDAEVEESVQIGPYVAIAPGALISGETVLAGAMVSSGATVADSHLNANASLNNAQHRRVFIGRDSVVSNSQMSEHSAVLSNSLVENSVLGIASIVGSGTEVEGSRLSGGVRVGKNTVIHDSDISEHTRVSDGVDIISAEIGEDVTIEKDVVIKKGAVIRKNAVLLERVIVEESQKIGAGKLVHRFKKIKGHQVSRNSQYIWESKDPSL